MSASNLNMGIHCRKALQRASSAGVGMLCWGAGLGSAMRRCVLQYAQRTGACICFVDVAGFVLSCNGVNMGSVHAGGGGARVVEGKVAGDAFKHSCDLATVTRQPDRSIFR